MKKTILISIALFCWFFSSASELSAQEQIADIELNQENYPTWREHILPAEAELEFLKIPWERTFKDGILKADQADKPVLLWAMNGHPLGCT